MGDIGKIVKVCFDLWLDTDSSEGRLIAEAKSVVEDCLDPCVAMSSGTVSYCNLKVEEKK